MRINEVLATFVNWDFIPRERCINSLTLYPSNPVFGLKCNGALSFDMKNGFTYHGVESELSGGSYWANWRVGAGRRRVGELIRGYITADATDDAGLAR